MNETEKSVRIILGEILSIQHMDEIDIRQDLQVLGMDSLNYVEIIMAIEEKFEIFIPEGRLGLMYKVLTKFVT